VPRELKVYVFIYLPGETVAVPAGIFTNYPVDGIGRFAYGLRYIERPNALPVDPVALQLGSVHRDATINGGLYGAFRDSSPDYWGRLVIAAEMKSHPESLGEVDFLLHGNASRVGCLDFRVSLEQGEPERRPPSFQSLTDILEAARQLQHGEPIRHDLLQLLEQGTSIGGARPKCTVELDDALWIAKFPAKGDTVNFPRIEYATMLLAKSCGITIPELRLITIGDKDVLLVKRFDRLKTAIGYERFGYLSALSMMEWDERDRTQWSYPALADKMRATVLAQPTELKELFRRMLFNILCRNTDDHPRNHGFLWSKQGLALSPAYDIVPTPTRSGVGTEFSLSMSLGDRGREATMVNAMSLSVRFGLSRNEARLIVEEITEHVGTWEEHFVAQAVSPVDLEAIRACFMGTFAVS